MAALRNYPWHDSKYIVLPANENGLLWRCRPMSMDYCGGTGQWEWTIVVLQANEYGLLWQPKLAAKSINFLISRILLSKLLKIIFYCVFDKASIPHSQRSGLLGLKRWWPAQLALSKNSFYQKIETNSWNSSQGESQWLGKHGFNSSRVLKFSTAPKPFCVTLNPWVNQHYSFYIAVLSSIFFFLNFMSGDLALTGFEIWT